MDTDGNEVGDDDEDSDGDGLVNKDEELYGSNPGVMDTDDDGIQDGAEVDPMLLGLRTSPLHSLGAPTIQPRSMSLSNILGGAGVTMPQVSTEYAEKLDSWTVETWFYSSAASCADRIPRPQRRLRSTGI